MYERLRYVNHKGQEFVTASKGLFANYNDLRDFSWEYVTKNNRIVSFKKGINSKKIPLLIAGDTVEEAIKAKNRLFEIAETDVIGNEYGRIYIGDYYLRCYITESKKSDYLVSKRVLRVTVTVTTDLPAWICESKTSFTKAITVVDPEGDLDYPYDYQHDYFNNMVNRKIVNDEISAADFELIIYGSCTNPQIIIGGHSYKVNVTIATGEYLVVNSMTRKIYKVKNNGEKVNMFHFRDRDSDIFEQIPAGSNTVSWSGFGFDITLYKERSEPRWI